MIRKDKRRVKNTAEGNKDELKQVKTTTRRLCVL